MSGPFGWVRQVFVVSGISLRTVPRRLGASLSAAVGVAGVVATLVAVLSIAEGFRETLASSGTPDTALVMRGGTDAEMNSLLELEDARIVADAAGVRRGPHGPMISPELFVIVDVPKRSTGTDANVPLRGVQPMAFEIRDRVAITQGRMFEPGKNEIIAGVGAVGQFSGLEIGSNLRWGENRWTVVGYFTSGGSSFESELWCDLKVLQPAYRRGTTIQSIYARLESPEAFVAFKDALAVDPRLDVKVLRESEYFAEQSETLRGLITGLGFLVAGLMGVGAVFGAINTMYSAVSARTREIATLRALGFASGPVVLSVLVESILLAAIGGSIGGIASYVAFNGYRAATLNWDSFAQVVFAFKVTPQLMLTGILLAIVLGVLGGLLPAYRAARLPVATALREF